MDTQPSISVQSLVVFPAFVLEISVHTQKDLDRLESLCRVDPTNPLGDRVLNAMHAWLADGVRANNNIGAWLALKDPERYKKILSCYKNKQVTDNGKETG